MRRWRLSAVLLSLFSVFCLIIQSVSAGPEAVSTGPGTLEPNDAVNKSGAVTPATTITSGGEGGSASIGTLMEEIHCEGFCLDLNRSRIPDEEDAWLVYVVTGNPVVLGDGGTGIASCVDGVFSSDGYVDSYDICSWDWALKHPDCVQCGEPRLIPLSGGDFATADGTGSVSKISVGLRLSSPDPLPEGLLILGKSQTDLLSDSLCIPDKPTAESYAWPCLARVYLADENVQATYLSGPNLTVPMSMVWTGQVK